MDTFLTRVELHGPSPDYERLHAQMAVRGFKRTIPDSANVQRKLPAGTYQCSSTGDRTTVYQAAAQAAQAVHHTYSIIVVPFTSWYGNLPVAA